MDYLCLSFFGVYGNIHYLLSCDSCKFVYCSCTKFIMNCINCDIKQCIMCFNIPFTINKEGCTCIVCNNCNECTLFTVEHGKQCLIYKNYIINNIINNINTIDDVQYCITSFLFS